MSKYDVQEKKRLSKENVTWKYDFLFHKYVVISLCTSFTLWCKG